MKNWLRNSHVCWVCSCLSVAVSIVPLSRTWAAPQPLPVPSILDSQAMKDGKNGAPSVSPCDDFYQFACGQWIDQTQIPTEKSGVSRQAMHLWMKNQNLL